MTEKKISIQGVEYPVVFNMKTIMNFEEITGDSFFASMFGTMKNRIALICSAALSADADTKLTVETLIGSEDYQSVMDVINAYSVVDSLAGEFFKVPEIEKQNDPEPEPEEDVTCDKKPKN